LFRGNYATAATTTAAVAASSIAAAIYLTPTPILTPPA
jgi:hypothetical protein